MWQEFDLNIYHKKMALAKLERFLATKFLKIQIQILNEIIFEMLETKLRRSQKDFQNSYVKILKELQLKLKIKKENLEWCKQHFQ